MNSDITNVKRKNKTLRRVDKLGLYSLVEMTFDSHLVILFSAI